MPQTTDSPARPIQPMDPQLKDIQPGSGIVIHLEQAWGSVRRLWLMTFRSAYVRRMESLRKGDFNPCPHDALDPRDLKFYRNQDGWYWDESDDPFTWRDRIPFARVGLAELLVMGGGFALSAIILGWWSVALTGVMQVIVGGLSLVNVVCFGLVAWFFRDPARPSPTKAGLVMSPADGKVVEIEELDHDDHVGGPAVKIGIFLSIFNVHINRAPVSGRVVELQYRPGKYLNALRPESARENERLTVLMETDDGHHRGIVIRQITGAIARRIVCWLKPGDELQRGEQFGMIKLGSRTELLLPNEDGLAIRTQLGDKVKAGTSILADFGMDNIEGTTVG